MNYGPFTKCSECGRTKIRLAVKYPPLCKSCHSKIRRRKEYLKLSEREKHYKQLKLIYNREVADKYIDADVCEICGFKREGHYNTIHHKDCNRKNNNLKNLIGLCYYCHRDIHKKYYSRY